MNGVHLTVFFRVAGPTARAKHRENDMILMPSRERPDQSRTAHDRVPRVAGGRGWRTGEQREGTAWWPATDVSEGSDAYRVTVEIPGIKADEVEISIADGLLTIQGERHAAPEASREKLHLSERGYGVFSRSLPLPSGRVAVDKVLASVRDGVLEILVPKAIAAPAIPIRVSVAPETPSPRPRPVARTSNRGTEILVIDLDGISHHSPAASQAAVPSSDWVPVSTSPPPQRCVSN